MGANMARRLKDQGFSVTAVFDTNAAAAAALAVSACNTVAGAGRDVSAAGHAVTDTAHDAAHAARTRLRCGRHH